MPLYLDFAVPSCSVTRVAILADSSVYPDMSVPVVVDKGATVPVRVTANLPDPVVDTLLELARKKNTHATEVITSAISLARQLDEEVSQGGKIFIQKRDGSLWRQDVWARLA